MLLHCAGLVGLALSYALTLTSSIIFWTRWYCNLLNYLISVERIKQFIHLPSEPPAIVKDHQPPSSWPSKGRIDLQALEVKFHRSLSIFLLCFNKVSSLYLLCLMNIFVSGLRLDTVLMLH